MRAITNCSRCQLTASLALHVVFEFAWTLLTWYIVSRWDRLLVFGALNLAALALFVICFTLFPILSIKPKKFAILYVCISCPFLSLVLFCFSARGCGQVPSSPKISASSLGAATSTVRVNDNLRAIQGQYRIPLRLANIALLRLGTADDHHHLHADLHCGSGLITRQSAGLPHASSSVRLLDLAPFFS